MATQAPPYNNTARHHNHHNQSSTSSSELWRQFWAFPHSFSFCKTSSVVERLRQSRSPGMTSLRLVGVEGYQNYVTALCQALRENTTLEQVSICGSFLQHYPPPHLNNQDDDDPLYPVFRAIGGLPKLTRIKLEGNEDAKVFPISLLTTMLSACCCCGRPTKASLQEFTCHYVDLEGTPGEWLAFGQVLEQLARAGNLQSVTMMNIQILLVQQPTTNPTSEPSGVLDPILSNLSHCPHVELGWRQRHNHHATADNDSNNHNGVDHEWISPLALQKLLLVVPFDNHPSCNATINTNNNINVLQQLTLGRRIPLQYSPHLSTILECLQVPPSLSSSSSSASASSASSCRSLLQELQLDNIHFSTNHEVALLWQQMAAMLKCNTTLQSVDLTFASSAAAAAQMTNDHNNVAADDEHRNNVATAPNSMTTIMMDLASTTVMTKALAVNKSLKRLCLRGGGAGTGVMSGTSSMATSCQKMWLILLEQHNYTLEELVLFEDDFHPPSTDTTSATAPKSQDHPTDEYHEKMQFYLQLNRQPVKLRQQNNGNNDNENTNLRALLHNSNGALAPEHILPCLEAAMEVQNNAYFHEHHCSHSHPQAVIGASTLFDSWFDRDFVEDDDDDDDDVFGASTATSRRHHPKKHIGDISGLYYLLSQHPCILLTLQERLSKINDNPKTTPGTQLTNDTKDFYKKASIALGGGASPQLLLLDDDIVALW